MYRNAIYLITLLTAMTYSAYGAPLLFQSLSQSPGLLESIESLGLAGAAITVATVLYKMYMASNATTIKMLQKQIEDLHESLHESQQRETEMRDALLKNSSTGKPDTHS